MNSGKDAVHGKPGGLDAAGIKQALAQFEQAIIDVVRSPGFGSVTGEVVIRDGRIAVLNLTNTETHKLL